MLDDTHVVNSSHRVSLAPDEEAKQRRWRELAQELADAHGEPTYFIPDGHDKSQYRERIPYVVLHSQADPWEKDPANHRFRCDPASARVTA